MPDGESTARRRRLLIIVIAAALGTVAGVGLLMNILERKQEARNPFYRVVELTDDVDDPATWGKNFPLQYDDYRRTVDQVRTRFGGSEALPRTPTKADPRSLVAQSKIEEDPRLKVMWAGYAFARDFREERGHAYMLDDQTFTGRQQSYWIAPRPLELAFGRAEIGSLLLGVLIGTVVSGDGRSNWYKGVQLITVYVILALMFYFMPEAVHG